MKTKTSMVALLTAVLAIPASAVTINLYSGNFRNSSGVAVPDGTLFALVADSNADNLFGGGIGLNSTLNTVQANTLFAPNQVLTLNSLINGDSIFYLGTTNGVANAGQAGLIDRVVNFNLTAATQGLNYAIYFFPGGTLNGTNGTIGSQAGGINSIINESGATGNDPMTIPGSNAANVNQGPLDVDNGGAIPTARFTAVNLIPEPSAALLGALGALGLLRRRR